MAERQIIIGREGNQPFKIPDGNVGRSHAILLIGSNGLLQLVDNDSKNGTFVYNGLDFVRLYPGQRYKVTPDTFIRLGPETGFHIRKLFDKPKQNPSPAEPRKTPEENGGGSKKPPQPEKSDISHLRIISDKYEKRKIEIESNIDVITKVGSMPLIFIGLFSAAGAVLSEKLNIDNPDLIKIISIGLGVILIVSLFVYSSMKKKQYIKQRADNERQYAIHYVCPRCHASFRGKVYENVLAEGQCPKCKVRYYDKNIKN